MGALDEGFSRLKLREYISRKKKRPCSTYRQNFAPSFIPLMCPL